MLVSLGSAASGVGGRDCLGEPKSRTQSIQDRLEKVQALRDKGLITEEEYQKKRKSIINAI